MTHDSLTAQHLESCIARMNGGDNDARDDLLQHCRFRFEVLARRMLRDFPKVRRWEETGDVLQNALLRLLAALQEVRPTSFRHFLSLATLQIRRELIDLARKHQGPQGIGANQRSWRPSSGSSAGNLSPEPEDATYEPSQLASWCDLHAAIENLPSEEREVCELLWYQGITQIEAAKVLGVSERTVKRRWQAARLRLHDVWISPPPSEES